MSEAVKFTPGPHAVEQIGRRPIMKAVAATVLSSSGERLADFRHVADANLFAAAPEMLTALQILHKWFEITGSSVDARWNRIPPLERSEIVKATRAAIAKAEGGQS